LERAKIPTVVGGELIRVELEGRSRRGRANLIAPDELML
jgi:hypothetical protein